MATKFGKIIEELEYAARCRQAVVIFGIKGIFGETYLNAMEAQLELDRYNEAIELLREHDVPL